MASSLFFETEKVIKQLYSFVDKLVDKMVLGTSADVGDEEIGRNSISYGELTQTSVQRVINAINDLGPKYKFDTDSVFIDIGSGFGKVVFHVVLATNIKEAFGVECVVSRCKFSAAVGEKFLSSFNSTTSSLCSSSQTESLLISSSVINSILTKCHFVCEDGISFIMRNTKTNILPALFNVSLYDRSKMEGCTENNPLIIEEDEGSDDKGDEGLKKIVEESVENSSSLIPLPPIETETTFPFTHIFMCDRVFSDNLFKRLSFLNYIPFKILISSKNEAYLKKRGVINLVRLATVCVALRGSGEHFNMYLYGKNESIAIEPMLVYDVDKRNDLYFNKEWELMELEKKKKEEEALNAIIEKRRKLKERRYAMKRVFKRKVMLDKKKDDSKFKVKKNKIQLQNKLNKIPKRRTIKFKNYKKELKMVKEKKKKAENEVIIISDDE